MTRMEGKVYLTKADMPKKCIQCPFLNGSDECILQDEDTNFAADSFDDLHAGCPLEELPTVQAGRWIPVTERLPEVSGCYLVTVKNDHERRYSKTAWYHGHGNWFTNQAVTYWMPLPEPPKEV